MQFKNCLVALAFLFSAGLMNAQTFSFSDAPSSLSQSYNQLPSPDGDSQTFYLDANNKIYYIDFETISVNLSDIKVVNESGRVVRQDDLSDLPVNTIYELDLTDLKPGTYRVELRSYTGLLTREVTISD